jgi:Uncharacterized protein conserved in bacteria (DUF2330)
MRQILSFLLLLFLPVAALADGKVIPTFAFPTKITIPDQQALICYTNGTERLVIETRFTGAGTNFAWVVPLPSQPVIEEATTGLFPTLRYLFRPQIVHNVPRYYIGILLAVGFVYLLRLTAKSVWNAFVIAILILIPAILLLPALSTAKRAGMSSVTSSQVVSILDRKIVGVFETTTIGAHDTKALQAWLSENGFAVPTNAEPVIESYIKDGWVFVAAKVRRDNADTETSTPHPLSFNFKTDKPVYPMRLTGVDNGPLSVELYVFSSARAEAAHFKVERCTRPNYPQPPSPDDWHWSRWGVSETPDIVHPLLRQWVNGSPVATKLVGILSPADMRQDVWLGWGSFSEKKNHLFSQTGALTIALNWGTGVAAVGLIGVFVLVWVTKTLKAKLPRLIGIVTVTSFVLAGLIYLCLPKIEVRLVKDAFVKMEYIHHDFSMDAADEITNHPSIAAARITANNIITVADTNAPYWNEWSSAVRWTNWQNYYLGGPIREEDSPGNYIIREVNGQLELVTFNAEGAEHIQFIGE